MWFKTKLLLWPLQSWPEPCRTRVKWTEEKHRHGAGNLKGLEWFWMKELSLISCQVFSNLIRHYRRKCLGYVCNPRSLKEGTETSRRRTDELGYRLERPIHFECKLNEPMHIGMRLLHPAAADHSVSINRQQVQRIFRFSLRSRAGNRPLSGGTGAVATGRDVSVPSFRERGLHT